MALQRLTEVDNRIAHLGERIQALEEDGQPTLEADACCTHAPIPRKPGRTIPLCKA